MSLGPVAYIPEPETEIGPDWGRSMEFRDLVSPLGLFGIAHPVEAVEDMYASIACDYQHSTLAPLRVQLLKRLFFTDPCDVQDKSYVYNDDGNKCRVIGQRARG